jgi:hypothetical protein
MRCPAAPRGGALGSYQAGVYEALAEADLHPDWVAGISIGAINSALIAGNAGQFHTVHHHNGPGQSTITMVPVGQVMCWRE